MFSCYVNNPFQYRHHGLTKEYVRLLIEKGLMQYLDGERTFKTTDKGMNFLRINNKVHGLNPLTTKSQRNDSPSHDAIILTE